jgi:hypothetical protein
MPIRDTEDVIYSTSLERARPEACEDGERGTVHRERWRVNRWPLVSEGPYWSGRTNERPRLHRSIHASPCQFTDHWLLPYAMGCI